MRNFTFLTNNIDINKAPENFVEMLFYQAYLDDNINNSQMINYLYTNGLDIFSNKTKEEKKDVLLILNKEFFIGDYELTDDKKDLYLDLTEEVAKRRFDIQYIMRLLGHFTFLYGYTEEQILESYYRKWKKNIKRIGNEWR